MLPYQVYDYPFMTFEGIEIPAEKRNSGETICIISEMVEAVAEGITRREAFEAGVNVWLSGNSNGVYAVSFLYQGYNRTASLEALLELAGTPYGVMEISAINRAPSVWIAPDLKPEPKR